MNDFTGFGIFTTPSHPQDIEADFGPGDFDMPHRVTLIGVFEPRTGLTGVAGALLNGWLFAPRIIAAKGYPMNPATGQDTNGDTVFNDLPAGLGRNSFRQPGYSSIDLRFSRRFSFAEQRNIELIVEGFNLGNYVIPRSVNQTWGPNTTANATFGTVTSARESRQFQIGARWNF